MSDQGRSSDPVTFAGRLGVTAGAVAAIGTIVTVGISVSLVTPLVSLTLASRGTSERLIGLVVATYALAMLVASPMTARIAGRFGAANMMIVLAVVAAMLIPLFWLIESVPLLFVVAFIYGGCVALLFALSEFWITADTPDSRRGFVVGLYATLLAIGFAVGPATIALLGADSIRPFLIGSVLMLLAALPALFARRESPRLFGNARTRFSTFLLAVPTATLGALAFAMGESAGFAFLPLWGYHLGFSPTLAVLLASAMTLGNVAFQIPLGLLADRTDRRRILLVLGIIGAVGMPSSWAVSDHPAALMAVLFLWGGSTAGIYTVGLAHLASRYSAGDLASANAAFVFCYGLGMLIGPALVGDAITRAPLFGFPLVLGIAFALYSLIVGFRIATVKR